MSKVLGNANLTQAIESSGLITIPKLDRAGLDPCLSQRAGYVSNPHGQATANLSWTSNHKTGSKSIAESMPSMTKVRFCIFHLELSCRPLILESLDW